MIKAAHPLHMHAGELRIGQVAAGTNFWLLQQACNGFFKFIQVAFSQIISTLKQIIAILLYHILSRSLPAMNGAVHRLACGVMAARRAPSSRIYCQSSWVIGAAGPEAMPSKRAASSC